MAPKQHGAGGGTKAANLSVIDRAIAAVSPGWAASRADARVRLERTRMVEGALRAYDGNAWSRRTRNWLPSSASGSAVTQGLDRLRNRAHDLAANNEWCRKGLGVIRDGVVGAGFTVKWQHADKGFAAELQARWTAWADSLEIDPEGLENLDAKLGSGVHAMAEGGDVLFRRRWRRPEDQLTVPLQVQLLEGEHIDTERNEQGADGSRIVQGIEYDPLGRRRAYWLLRNHPGDANATARSSVAVPASEVLHLFRVERPGAVRGVPWAAPCVLRLWNFATFDDAMLTRVMIANMFVGTVKMSHEVAAFADDSKDGSGRVYQPIDELKPGTHQYLNPGESLEWSNPPIPGIELVDYSRVTLQAVAAGLQVPYESLTGDLKNTSFASGRLSRLDFRDRIEVYRWQMLVPRVCNPIAAWFREAVAITDKRATEAVALFVPPPRDWIDPVAEVNAMEKAVRAGFKSREQVVRLMGDDPELVLAEQAADNLKAKAAGVLWTTNPENDLGRKTDGPGRRPGEGANAPR